VTSLHSFLWQMLAYGVFPAWVLAAFADWLCHRHTAIELTSGPRESALHLLLHAEIALPVLLGLYFDINAGLLAVMAVCVLAHMWTSLRDTAFALPLRYISPVEQQVHGWLEMTPLFALMLVAALHLDAFTEPQWRLAWRLQPVPRPWSVVVPIALAAGFALIIEEYVRGRHSPRF
jgi:hypothetical protein